MKIRRFAAAFAVLSILLITGVFAQATTATLKGRVVDSEGTGLPGVPVTVNSKSHGDAKKTVMTDIEGDFKFQLLPPANDYTLSVNYPGFAPIELGPIDLDPGKTTVQDITLRTQEEMTTRVEVVAHGSIVDTESTKTSTSFNTEFIEGLPIIGRNYQDILTLTPGVTDTDGDGNPNVQGARATGLQYRLDGGNITDPASGTFGQNLNSDAIEEIEVITSGAGAEYGRADGGFANVVTKSGGNDFEGSFKLFWRGAILDGDGARENQDTFFLSERSFFDLRNVSPYVTLGGALKKDRLWYFATYQGIDRVDPVSLAGISIPFKRYGHRTFAKLTWQINSDNKLAVQYNDDPETIEGIYLDFGVDLDSDALWEQGGRTPQLRWTSIISPTLLMETLLTAYDTGIARTPVSRDFHVTHVDTTVERTGNLPALRALYPVRECSPDGSVTGLVPNCDPGKGRVSIYQQDLLSGTITGPFPNRDDDSRIRNSIKTDLSYTVEDAWGEHQIKSGLEFADEKYENTPVRNPYFINLYRDCPGCRLNGLPVPNAVIGIQNLVVPTPVVLNQRAVSFNSTAYIQDSWKPKPNLTLQVGLRIDREDIDSSGFSYFDPRAEKQASINIIGSLCADARRVAQAGGESSYSNSCDPSSGFIPGRPPVGILRYQMDEETPERLRRFDASEDGIFDSNEDRIDGLNAWDTPFTIFADRSPENFEVTNLNLSPRFSISWDPWADGKTKIFSTWGRFYDRLYLTTVLFEMGPDSVNYTFTPGGDFVFGPERDPGGGSTNIDESLPASAVSINQIDRNLRTPFTDSFTVGFERELAPEWSARVTFTQKLGWNLLQDVDYNHLLCTEHDDVFGIAPSDVCTLYTTRNPNTGRLKHHLSDDRFGNIFSGGTTPNGVPDLYVVNPSFNEILRVGNFNNSTYRSAVLEINKRLHRNWQMQASYTWSRAVGQAEDFLSALGNDASTKDDERGYLAFDQRHRVVFISTTHLPKDVELGGTITWEGGTPYSVTRQALDMDNALNVSFRTAYPTHQRNDQRNGNFWGIDLQTTKRFVVGKVQASAQVAVNNILNMDDLTLEAYRVSSFNGVQLDAGPQGLRRFGRFWELGLTFNF
jgi:outer membrane receptor protein involved in Fe transport